MVVPPDWQHFPFPFVGSQLDRSLFPVVEWREASKLTLSLPEIERLGGGQGERRRRASSMQEIRSKVLPRRGIHARPGRGARHRGRPAGAAASRSSSSSSPARRSLSRSPAIRSWSRSSAAAAPRSCSSPWTATAWWWISGSRTAGSSTSRPATSGRPASRSRPNGARRSWHMAAEERDFLVVEDDFESEADDLGGAPPALRAGGPGPPRRLLSRRCCSRSHPHCASASWSPRRRWCARRARSGASRPSTRRSPCSARLRTCWRSGTTTR